MTARRDLEAMDRLIEALERNGASRHVLAAADRARAALLAEIETGVPLTAPPSTPEENP